MSGESKRTKREMHVPDTLSPRGITSNCRPASKKAAQLVAAPEGVEADLRTSASVNLGKRATAPSQRGRAPHARPDRLEDGREGAGPPQGPMAESHRVGNREPLSADSIRGPLQLHDRSNTAPPTGTNAPPEHPSAGTRAPRHLGGSSNTNPHYDSRIGGDSQGKAYSVRAAGPRGQGAQPSQEKSSPAGRNVLRPELVAVRLRTRDIGTVRHTSGSIGTPGRSHAIQSIAAHLARGNASVPNGLGAPAINLQPIAATAASQRWRASLDRHGTNRTGRGRASSTFRRAAEDDRLGIHQPLPAGNIGGPWRQRSRSKATSDEGNQTRLRHQAAGARALRNLGGSICTTSPRHDSGLGVDSTGEAHSHRAATPRGQSAQPGPKAPCPPKLRGLPDREVVANGSQRGDGGARHALGRGRNGVPGSLKGPGLVPRPSGGPGTEPAVAPAAPAKMNADPMPTPLALRLKNDFTTPGIIPRTPAPGHFVVIKPSMPWPHKGIVITKATTVT